MILNLKYTDKNIRSPKVLIYEPSKKKVTKVEFSELRGDYFCSVSAIKNSSNKLVALSKMQNQSVYLFDMVQNRTIGIGQLT